MIIKGNFAVNDIPFAQWFNESFRASDRFLFPNPINVLYFEDLMTHLKDLTGKAQISLNEFIGHFAIIYNETGGTFQPLREWGSMKYFFEPNSRGKVSYNRVNVNQWDTGNRLAGDQLLEWGLISTKEEVDVWNGQEFPSDAPREVILRAVDCDFYRFRGGGFNQITWRNNYYTCLQPLIAPRDIDSLSEKEINDLIRDTKISARMFLNYISNSPQAREAIRQLSEGSFTEYGMLVSGGWVYYVQRLFNPRCVLLQQALREARLSPLMIYAIDGLNLPPAMIKRLQEVIVGQGNIEASRLIWQFGGIDGIWGPATQAAYEKLDMHLSDLLLWAYQEFESIPTELNPAQVRLLQKGLLSSGFAEVADLVRYSGGADGILGENTQRAFLLWKEKVEKPSTGRLER
ncbi:MAG: hypothetical protein NW226_25215 [Microscillaceae bacterium]|nr:hypothetical protein [Microscillaceae bacterium]